MDFFVNIKPLKKHKHRYWRINLPAESKPPDFYNI